MTSNKIKIIVIISCFLLSPLVYAFDTQISGKIVNCSKKGISNVKIELCNSLDSSLILRTKSDSLGNYFLISNDMNHQILKFTKNGYKVKYINLEDFVAKSTSINLGVVKLTKINSRFSNKKY